MRSLQLFILLLLCSASGFGQKKFNALMASLFDKGYQLCEDSMFDDALKVYEEIMDRADEGSTEYGKAMYNSGYAYLAEGKIKEARKTFLDILDADYDEMDRGGSARD